MTDSITSIDDRASYAIGRQMGEQLVKSPFEGMQTEAVLSGMADALAGRESPISLDDMNEAIDDLNKSGRWPQAVVTGVDKAMPFWPAEEYHQRYLQKNGYGSCSF